MAEPFQLFIPSVLICIITYTFLNSLFASPTKNSSLQELASSRNLPASVQYIEHPNDGAVFTAAHLLCPQMAVIRTCRLIWDPEMLFASTVPKKIFISDSLSLDPVMSQHRKIIGKNTCPEGKLAKLATNQ
jgi:hypothetical protein